MTAYHWNFHEPNEVAAFVLIAPDGEDAMLATDDAKGRIVLDFQSPEMREHILKALNNYAPMLTALKAAELELEANKTAMLGPEWAAQRTATGGALLQVSRAVMQAEGRLC